MSCILSKKSFRTQEQILRDSGYPEETMKEHSNFWGLKPPN